MMEVVKNDVVGGLWRASKQIVKIGDDFFVDIFGHSLFGLINRIDGPR